MSNYWQYGFFFRASEMESGHMYFVCFQRGSQNNYANQIVITPVQEAPELARKVAYALHPDIEVVDYDELDTLCRIAVGDFIEKLAHSIELPSLSWLDRSCRPWSGATLTV